MMTEKQALPGHFVTSKPLEVGDGFIIQTNNGQFVVGIYVEHNFAYITLDHPLLMLLGETPAGQQLQLMPYGLPFMSAATTRRSFAFNGIIQGEHCTDKRLLAAVRDFRYEPSRIVKAPGGALDKLNAALNK